MRKVALAAWLVAACADLKPIPGHLVDKPGLADAQVLIWRDVYARTDAYPLVLLVEELTCTDPNSGSPGFDCPTVGCREGCTGSPLAVHVAYSGQRWAETTLAHEDMHALKIREALVLQAYTPKTMEALRALGDRDHKDPEWQPGGAVDKATQRLGDLGL